MLRNFNYAIFQVMNIFIIAKITKSARFRRQFQCHDDDEHDGPTDCEEVHLGTRFSRGRFQSAKIQAAPKSSGNTPPGLGANLAESPGGQKLHLPAARVLTRGFHPRRTFFKKQQDEHTLGIILIGMSSLFIFCQSFKIIPDLYELMVCGSAGNLGHNCAISKVPVMNVITRMSHLLVCFNSSTNFLIYYLNGEKFRRAWVETFGWSFCCCLRKPNVTPSATIMMQTIKTEVPGESEVAIPSTGNFELAKEGSKHFFGKTNASKKSSTKHLKRKYRFKNRSTSEV